MDELVVRRRSSTQRRSGLRSLLGLWPYVRPVRSRVFSASFLAVVASCLALGMTLVLKWMVDGPVRNGSAAGVWLGGGILLFLGAAEAGIFGIRRWLAARPLAAVEASMRDALYRHVQRLPLSFHDRWPSGQLLSRGTTDLRSLHTFLALPLTFLPVNAVTLLVGCTLLLAQSWLLGLVFLVPVLPLLALGSLLEARYALASRQARDQGGDLTTAVVDSVLGIRVVKSFGYHRSLTRTFQQRARSLHRTELGKARVLATLSALLVALPEAALGAALTVGAVQIADGNLSAGTLLAFLTIALELRPAVSSTGLLLAMSGEAATAADRFFDVLNEPAPLDAVSRQPRQWKQAAARPAALTFDGVEFRYPDAPTDEPAVLTSVNLQIAPGETVALVGATGSGKTTLAALVPRLHEPTAGRILLDGRDITTLTRAELRRQVSVTLDEPTLFSATVSDNVLLGADRADTADLTRALDIAQAHGFVQELPHGVHTALGEHGMSLSGGQRQRLALARSVVGEPRLLVLDDPLSALDIHTESLIEAALRRVLATTTALVIAHRPSTVVLADRVALLSHGRIAAVGTHDELLRSNEEYASLMTAVGSVGKPVHYGRGGGSR